MGRLHQRFFAAILALMTLAAGTAAAGLFVHYEWSARQVERLVVDAHEAWLLERFERRSRAVAEATAQALAQPLARLALSEMDALAVLVAAGPEVRAVSIFDHEGTRLLRRTGPPAGDSPGPSLASRPERAESAARQLRLDLPVRLEARDLGSVRLDFTLADVRQDLGSLVSLLSGVNRAARSARLVWLLALAVLILALTVLSATTVARVFSRPVEGLAKLTDRIRYGERPHDFPTERTDEVGDLARALARLVQDLERTTVSRDKFDQILANMRDGLLVTDPQGQITDANQAILRLLGLRFDEIAGQPIRRFLADHPGNPARSLDSFETRLRAGEGGRVPVLLSSSPIAASGGRADGAVYVVHDITERKRAEQRVQYLAHHDVLTGLPNRALLADRLRQMIALARRERVRVALLLLDLVDFKAVNDTFGHAAGDDLLKQAAARISITVRRSDTAARFGGDEFVVLQMARHPPGDVDGLCRRLQGALTPALDVQGAAVRLSLSIGIAVFPRDGEELDQLLRAADRALYEAKSGGRGTWRFASY